MSNIKSALFVVPKDPPAKSRSSGHRFHFPLALLQVEAVGAVKAATTQLLIRAAALRETCTQVMAEYRLFFSWLLRTVLRLGEDAAAVPEGGAPINVAAVAHFLQGQFHTDTVGQELQVRLESA